MKIKEIYKKINSIKLQIANFKTLAIRQGQYHSIKLKRPVDASGNALPWYTYPVIEYLIQFDYSEKEVFEYGCGNSSIFWAERAHSVVSVEDDEDWYEAVRKEKLPNQAIILGKNKDIYLESLAKQGKKFDIIVIDASYRKECAIRALNYLKDDGFIILDNSDWFIGSADVLRKSDLIQVDFAGFGPGNGYAWVTSLFLSRKIMLKPLGNQPEHCIGGVKQHVAE